MSLIRYKLAVYVLVVLVSTTNIEYLNRVVLLVSGNQTGESAIAYKGEQAKEGDSTPSSASTAW